MSKEEEKKNEDGKKQKVKEPKGPPDEIAETRKKRKLVLFAGLTGVIATAAAAGGFFVYKTFVQKPTALSAKAEPNEHASADSAHDTKAEKDTSAGDSKDSEKQTEKPEHQKDEKTDHHGKDGHTGDKEIGKKDSDHAAAKKDDANKTAASGHNDDSGVKQKTADGSENEKKDEKSDIKMFQSNESFGETFALKKMELNLGNPLENRYLRIAVSLEYTGGKEQLEELQKREPQLRDLIISSVSTRTRLDLLTEKGKEKLRRELINKINESFEKPVKTIYFTDFLVE